MLLRNKKRLSWLQSRATKVALGCAIGIGVIASVAIPSFYGCVTLRNQWERAVTLGSVLSTPTFKGRKSEDSLLGRQSLPRKIEELLEEK